jgi:hypothetical protein
MKAEYAGYAGKKRRRVLLASFAAVICIGQKRIDVLMD